MSRVELNGGVAEQGADTVRAGGGRLLTAWLCGAAFLWLVALPRVAAWPSMRAYIERNESAGIDPAAKFYSEVPAMPGILARVRHARAAGDETGASPGF